MGFALLILLDTHEWIWFADPSLNPRNDRENVIESLRSGGLIVSDISLLEVANAYRKGRLQIERPLETWLEAALSLEGVITQRITSAIAAESANLPGDFHKDPADRILVAPARVLDVPLLTSDDLIRRYPHVRLA
ncbi:type II toxin-antitoxin system VapC family toxin [soil metagenome]